MTDHQPLRGDETGVVRAGRRVGWDEHTDLVVVGLGAAGGAAAIEARTEGADVLLVDRFGGGGATGKSAGAIYFGGGTDLQRASGYEDSPENMFAYLKLETGDAVPESTLQAFCETSVEHFEWLRALGCPFPRSGEVVKSALPPDDCTLYFSGNELCPPFCDAATPAPRGHRPLGSGLTGHLTAASLRHGALECGVQLRPFTRAARLVVSGDGEVIGIELHTLPRALHPVGRALAEMVHLLGGVDALARRGLRALLERLEARAERRLVRARKGVVLAMGGFVFDASLMREHAPAYAPCSLKLGTAGDDGAGIRMGMAVGGAVGQMNRCSAPRFIDPPTEWWGGILVGRSGERICNETYYGGKIGDHLVEQHGGRGTLVLDATSMSAGRRQVFRGHSHLYQRIFGVINGWVTARSAPSLRQLARRFDIDPDALERTVARYNAGVREGSDALGKAPQYLAPLETPPFFGIPFDVDTRLFPTPCLTLGGLRTEGTSSRVLTDDGTPIDGLYAAGRTAVGVASNGYTSGLSISDGLFAGRNAGRHAARRSA